MKSDHLKYRVSYIINLETSYFQGLRNVENFRHQN